MYSVATDTNRVRPSYRCYNALFGYNPVTIEPACIQSDSPAPDGAGPKRNHPRKPLSQSVDGTYERLLEPLSDRRTNRRSTTRWSAGTRTRASGHTSSSAARTSSKEPAHGRRAAPTSTVPTRTRCSSAPRLRRGGPRRHRTARRHRRVHPRLIPRIASPFGNRKGEMHGAHKHRRRRGPRAG